MKRIRIDEETWEMLSGLAEPGETPQEALSRVLQLRYIDSSYGGRIGLTYKEVADRWGCSTDWIKQLTMRWRNSGGKVGLGPVVRLSPKKVLVPWSTLQQYEKDPVY